MQNNYSSDRATPASAKKNFKRIVLTGITLCLVLCVIFSFAACLFGGDDEADPTTPGQTEPETPSSDSDNSDNSNENDNDIWDDVIVPDDPVIDPDLPTDPEIPGEPEIPAPPEDPSDPDDSDTSDFPKSIYEVDEIDEINYFADEFVQILNDNYFDDIVSLLGKTASIDYVVNDSTTWRVSGSGNTINQIQCSFYYKKNGSIGLRVVNAIFENNNNVNAIINNKTIPSLKLDTSINIQAGESEIPANLDLGKIVISTIDPDNTLGGDIWCSIGSASPSNGKTYRPITVYQITENGVEEYYMVAEAPSADPTSIIANIQEGKYTTTSQSTEYTFTGMKIEQIPLPEEA